MTNTVNQSKTKKLASLGVFPTIEEDRINYFGFPYSVRNDCQVGQWTISEDDLIGKEIEFCLVGMHKMYGGLGKRKDSQWLQIWFVPAPSEAKLPKNTICTTLLKTQGINNFLQKIVDTGANGGADSKVWIGTFEKRSNDLGSYYVPIFKTRDKETEAEISQHQQLADFLQTNPTFVDPNLPASIMGYNTDAELRDLKILMEVTNENQEMKQITASTN